jgi:kinesin family member 18/19
MNPKESDFNKLEIVKVVESKVVFLLDPFEYSGHNGVFKNRSREQKYAFDFAFDKFVSQVRFFWSGKKTIFNNTTKFLLEGIVNGFNGTVFAYGATCAGKTYTMVGNDDNPGIMVLTLHELFSKVSENSINRDYCVKISYLEIYNEYIRDLLKENDEYLDIREDPQKGISINGLSELNVNNPKDILNLLK